MPLGNNAWSLFVTFDLLEKKLLNFACSARCHNDKHSSSFVVGVSGTKIFNMTTCAILIGEGCLKNAIFLSRLVCCSVSRTDSAV